MLFAYVADKVYQILEDDDHVSKHFKHRFRANDNSPYYEGVMQ